MRAVTLLVLATVFLGVGVLAGRGIYAETAPLSSAAQAQPPQPSPAGPPNILTGNDLGFRVDSKRGTTPIGTLVARINGQWVEVEFGTGVKRLTAK